MAVFFSDLLIEAKSRFSKSAISLAEATSPSGEIRGVEVRGTPLASRLRKRRQAFEVSLRSSPAQAPFQWSVRTRPVATAFPGTAECTPGGIQEYLSFQLAFWPVTGVRLFSSIPTSRWTCA